MSNCSKRKISQLIDNELSNDEAALIKKHCQNCTKCSTIYNDFLRIKSLVNSNFSQVQDFRSPVRKLHHTFRLPKLMFIRTGMPAISFIVLVVGFVLLIDSKLNNTTADRPFLLEKSASIMNSPLGTLAYYEEYGGKVIHSQFVQLTNGPADIIDKNNLRYIPVSTYESPLFNDTGTVLYSYAYAKSSSSD